MAAPPGDYEAVVVKNVNVWTVSYQMAPDGSAGRILSIVDEDGRHWFGDHDGGVTQSWRDGGVR